MISEETSQAMSPKEARSLMFGLGCAGAMNRIINQAFGKEDEAVEKATGPLCGGMMQQGLYCGMLWGASLAIGAESYRIHRSGPGAIGQAIAGTRHLMDSFEKQAGSLQCGEITACNQSSTVGVARYVLTGGPRKCIQLMQNWIPDAVRVAGEGLKLAPVEYSREPLSCATEVLSLMGATEEEQVMVAGFAGGLGLSGGACGALAAVIWFRTLDKTRKGKSVMYNPKAKAMLKSFKKRTGGEVRCQKICHRGFPGIDDHTAFLNSGACQDLIAHMAQS